MVVVVVLKREGGIVQVGEYVRVVKCPTLALTRQQTAAKTLISFAGLTIIRTDTGRAKVNKSYN